MLALIDYGMGNLRSVAKALRTVGGDVHLIQRPEQLQHADQLVLPGVGAVGDAMEALRQQGLIDPIKSWIRAERPFLGICLGLQMLFDESLENGRVAGLGLFPGVVRRFETFADFKVPHMGWNTIDAKRQHWALDGSTDNQAYYFVHSYYVDPVDPQLTLATCNYGGAFCAAIGTDRLFACQFHPEKSQTFGLELLRRFVSLPK